MGAYIKYKRITGEYSLLELQKLFDEIITDGFEIIYYHEKEMPLKMSVDVSIVVGRRQNKIL